MNIEYLRHEYAWSSQCITGTKVGWGITGSSTPLDKDRLIELEKLASGTVADPLNRVPIESLAYSPECGFTKMVTVPSHDGEDGRMSKIVHIYQTAELTNMVPEAYIAPGDEWDEERIGDYYEPLKADTMEVDTDRVLIEMGYYDRLPDFLQVVLEALLGEHTSMNFVVDWAEQDFAKKSRELMYAIHTMLPESLRKKASYQSFSRGEVSNVTFYFSNQVIGRHYIKTGEPLQKSEKTNDELNAFFYHRLAESYVKKDTLYPDIMDKVAIYYADHSRESNTLKKLQWILCALCIKQGEVPLSDEYIMREVPQLFYWYDEDKELKAAVDTVLEYFHTKPLDAEEHMSYERSLIHGYTKRSENIIGKEMLWSMQHLYHQRADLFKQQLQRIQRKNKNVYTVLMTNNLDDPNYFVSQIFESNGDSFESLKNYLLTMNMECASEAFKDLCLVKGIDFLNEDLFYMENYKSFDELVKKLGRQEQGAEILKNFITQLEGLRTTLDDERLETGCYVEKILNEYENTDKYNLLSKEKASRQIKSAPTLSSEAVSDDSSLSQKDVTDEIFFTEEEVRAAQKVIDEREKAKKAEQKEEKSEEKRPRRVSAKEDREESFLAFLLHTVPMGFMTGCMGYVLRYSLKIGHGKIALGMIGIWIIMMMNYMAYLQIKQRTIRTWQTIGLCLVEGILITVIGYRLSLVHVHLLFFIILGVLAVLISLNNLLQEREHRLRR